MSTTALALSGVSETTAGAVALCDLPLDQLAADIKREHEATLYSMRDSLHHARSAGVKLLEVRALVKEVQLYYEDLCCEPDEALAAKRATMKDEWNPVVTLNRGAIRTDACRVAAELREGKTGRGSVRQRLRRLEMKVLTARVKETTPNGEKAREANPAREKVAVHHVSPFEAYEKRTQNFIAETHALLTEPHGLLTERVSLSYYERERLAKLIADVRQALDELEEQAAAEAVT